MRELFEKGPLSKELVATFLLYRWCTPWHRRRPNEFVIFIMMNMNRIDCRTEIIELRWSHVCRHQDRTKRIVMVFQEGGGECRRTDSVNRQPTSDGTEDIKVCPISDRPEDDRVCPMRTSYAGENSLWRHLLRKPLLGNERLDDSCSSDSINMDNMMPELTNTATELSHTLLSTKRQNSTIPKTGKGKGIIQTRQLSNEWLILIVYRVGISFQSPVFQSDGVEE